MRNFFFVCQFDIIWIHHIILFVKKYLKYSIKKLLQFQLRSDNQKWPVLIQGMSYFCS